MTPYELVTNILLEAGADEDAADYALPAVSQWLTWRAEQLRAEGKFDDAVWFIRIANEISPTAGPPPGSGRAPAARARATQTHTPIFS